MFRPALFAVALACSALPAAAAELRSIDVAKPYAQLLADLKAALKAEKMGLVTEAGPTDAAKARGETIPGDRVLGVFRNDFAVTIIRAAPEAMIEAPVRFHVMETPDGARLMWKAPSDVFAPWAAEGGEALAQAAAQLDAIFEAIAARAAE